MLQRLNWSARPVVPAAEAAESVGAKSQATALGDCLDSVHS